MSRAVNIVGQKFNRWTVLSRYIYPGKRAKWLCLCDCGTEKVVFGQSITRGMSTSCGCYNSEKGRKEGNAQAWNMYFSRVIKQSARGRNIKFDLSIDFVKSMCSKNCDYCGIEPRKWTSSANQYLTSAYNKRTKRPDLKLAESKIIYVNGLDRIDSDGHYEISNVVPCCVPCNLAKLSMSVNEFESWIVRVATHRKLIK